MQQTNQNATLLTQKALSFWGIILIIWSIYRSNFQLSIEVNEFIIKPLVFLLPIVYFIKNIEKKDFFSSIWLKKKTFASDLLIFLSFTILFLSFYLLTSPILKYPNIKISSELPKIILINIFTATSEEILSLGFILKKLYEEKNNLLTSVFISAVLYFILRIPVLFTQPNLTGNILLYTLIISFFMNLSLGIIFILRKSLWLPIMLHTFYLTFIDLILF